MRNFDRGRGGGGGRRDFGRRDQGGGRGFDRPREMHQVICSNCGRETEVPFKPTGDRPVYCRECFAKMGGPAERRSDSRPSFGRREDRQDRGQGSNNSAQLDAINSKLDQLIKLLTPREEVKSEQEPVVVKKKRAAKKEPAPETPEPPKEV